MVLGAVILNGKEMKEHEKDCKQEGRMKGDHCPLRVVSRNFAQSLRGTVCHV